jgi:myosin heavy subunit
MMKTFACGRMVVALSFVFVLLVTNRIVAGDNGSVVVDSLRKTNLRRGLEFEQQQRQLVGERLTSTTSRREEELVQIEKDFDGENQELKSETEEVENTEEEFDSENQVLESETEELENTEKDFNNEKQELNSKTEELENTEKKVDSENQELNNETEVRENVEKEVDQETQALGTETEELENIEEFGNEDEVTETKTEELEDKEKELVGENEKSASEYKETLEKEIPAKNESTGEPPVQVSTEKPTLKQNTLQAEDEIFAEEEEVQELETALKQEEKVARQAGGLGIFLGIVAMIFTAHQMSDNPDGIYASICRLAITISSVGIKIMCMPCRKLIGGGGDPYSGHMPISTSDYSFRSDPYRSNANAGFEMR